MSDATSWERLPALDGRANPCLCCPPIPAALPLDAHIAVGFGDAHVERDGEEIYREPSGYENTRPCLACDGTGGGSDGKSVCGTCGGSGAVDDPSQTPAEYWDVAEAEKVASSDPDHDWRIVLYGPLHGEVYQRHGPNAWLLVEKNEGFA